MKRYISCLAQQAIDQSLPRDYWPTYFKLHVHLSAKRSERANLGLTCDQKKKNQSLRRCWISLTKLILQINNYRNFLRCWIGNDPIQYISRKCFSRLGWNQCHITYYDFEAPCLKLLVHWAGTYTHTHTNSMAYGTRRFNAAFTKALQ